MFKNINNYYANTFLTIKIEKNIIYYFYYLLFIIYLKK